MAEKPSDLPRWADSGGDIVEPSSGKKDVGWIPAERPPAQYFNWLLNKLYQWIQYLDAPVGTGSGAGLAATGGSSNGPGLQGTGGATNGKGVVGNGTGTGVGVRGTGGGSGAVGVEGVGVGANAGVAGTGGTNGPGTTGAGNGTGAGVVGTGGATGRGVQGTGGATSGSGVYGIGGAGGGIGVEGVGSGTGGSSKAGVKGTAADEAPGVWGVASSTSSSHAVQGDSGGNSQTVMLANMTHNSGIAVHGKSTSGTGSIGVKGESNDSHGVQGVSSSGYGGSFAGNATRAPLHLDVLSGAPSSAAEGDVYFDSTTHKLRVYASGSWVDLH